MKSFIKKLAEFVGVPIALVLGYVLMTVIFILVASVVSVSVILAAAATISDPSIYTVSIDIILILFFVWFFRLEKVRKGMAELRAQIWWNL